MEEVYLKNEFYNLAIEEMDLLVLDGFFGEVTKTLVSKRDSMKMNDFLFESYENIMNSVGIGKENMIYLTKLFLNLHIKSISVSSQETLDLLNALFVGLDDQPELESFSSYSEYLRHHMEYKHMNNQIISKEICNDSDRKNVATKALTAYSKGVEFIGKSFNQLIIEQEIINKNEYDYSEIYMLTIHNKIKRFEKLSENSETDLVKMIDRDIRNAESHLNGYYSLKKQAYIMKKTIYTNKKPRLKEYKIPVDEFLLNVYPKIGNYVQAFISSCLLVIFGLSDSETFKKAYSYIE